MTKFEKLLMIIVPLSGLFLLLVGFSHYSNTLNQQKSNFNPVYINSPKQAIKSQPIETVYNKKQTTIYKKNNFISSSDGKKRFLISDNFSHRKLKSSPPAYTFPKHQENKSNIKKNNKYLQQKRIRQQKEYKKKQLVTQCNYYRKMKKLAENKMKRGYKASQYNYLEKNRKHWAKLYSQNCFNR